MGNVQIQKKDTVDGKLNKKEIIGKTLKINFDLQT